MNTTIKVISTLSFIILPLMGMEPQGLKNIGNSCFMNAAMQCLAALPDFKRFLAGSSDLYNPESFAAAFSAFLQHQTDEFRLQDIGMRGWSLMKKDPGTTQDADEFLGHVLDQLIAANWPEGFERPRRRLARLFSIKTSSSLSYPAEGLYGTNQIDRHLSLNLPVHPDDIHISQCLHHFFEGDKVDYTLRTGRKIKADTRVSLDMTSKYLILNLKRKVRNPEGSMVRLLNALAFPLKNLPLHDYCLDPAKKLGNYDACGIIMHAGGADGGHYVAYVKVGQQWFYCNDTLVAMIPHEEVIKLVNRGYGENEHFLATTLIYERSSEPYALLEVEPWASPAVLKKAYERKLPTVANLTRDSALAEEIVEVLKDAYNQLSGND